MASWIPYHDSAAIHHHPIAHFARKVLPVQAAGSTIGGEGISMSAVKPTDKIKSLPALQSLVAQQKAHGKHIVFTNGCFDLLHAGHVSYLQQAKAIGDVLVVGLNSDASVRALKGEGRPFIPQGERALILAALGCVDYVVIFDELTPERTIEALKPDVHVKGGDYTEEQLPEAKLVRSYGGKVVILPLLEGHSTTQLIERIRSSSIVHRPLSLVPCPLSLVPCPVSRVVGIIPARYRSSRFEGKVLADIAGKPMIQHVFERAKQAKLLSEVIIATDDERVHKAAEAFGAKVFMTSPQHPSGTDRIAEVARGLECDIIANIQGDEPLIDPNAIDAAVQPLLDDPAIEMSTLATPIETEEEYVDPNVVKVVTDKESFALYFSRSPLPYFRPEGPIPHEPQFRLGASAKVLRHLGFYVYRRDFLLRYASWQRTPLETAEALEQLRALENGVRIKVVETTYRAIGVDTPEDLEAVRRLLEGAGNKVERFNV